MTTASLFQIGAVTIQVAPFSADTVDRQASADFATHDLLGRLKGREFVGEGDDTLTIAGTIFTVQPKLDGRRELEVLHGYRRSGSPTKVMRGDGTNLGWFVIEKISEKHEMLQRDGVGGVIKHEITMTKVSETTATRRANLVEPGQAMIRTLLSLFG